MTFPGFTSRCIIPLECTKSSAYLDNQVNSLAAARMTRSTAHLEQLERIIFDIKLAQHRKEQLPFHVLHVFHDETVVPRRGVLDDVSQGDDVRATREVTENFDFTLNLLWGYGFEDFDDAGLRVDHVDAFEDLRGVIERCGTLGT